VIREIDRLRRAYIGAISTAIDAATKLQRIDKEFAGMDFVPSQADIDEMNETANSIINRLATDQKAAGKAQTYIHVGGDMMQVGDITESDNIAIGKEIKQKVKRDRRFKPPSK